MIPFDLKIVFIDGKYIIIENVISYVLDTRSDVYAILCSVSEECILIERTQVRLIGQLTLIEDILF